jgi:hypothetical protein
MLALLQQPVLPVGRLVEQVQPVLRVMTLVVPLVFS